MPVIYCAATTSLCELEVLANSAGLPKGMVRIAAEVPDALAVLTIKDEDLPPDWQAPMAPESTKIFGTRWADSKATAVLSDPSAIVPSERNYILNPRHPDFSAIRFGKPEPIVFDPRLK
jgi:RES domain-containing protein